MSVIIKPGEVQCYHEELEVGEKITVSYQVRIPYNNFAIYRFTHYFFGYKNDQVGDGGNLDIDFWVSLLEIEMKITPFVF